MSGTEYYEDNEEEGLYEDSELDSVIEEEEGGLTEDILDGEEEKGGYTTWSKPWYCRVAEQLQHRWQHRWQW